MTMTRDPYHLAVIAGCVVFGTWVAQHLVSEFVKWFNDRR
jgi:hypothetical protein